ncbi:WecB/TagA/CpsF family glycosyltransferase [Candidatus Daviesbacteria bacterium]|nr:WecB/TagA/CpsF family glycosyltransferase [Candidatus Daviesbacteria bacterium]
MKKAILGIKIDDVTLDEATQMVENWLSKDGKHYIVTPNPEIVVMAQDDEELKKIINRADLAIPDGVGLKLSGDIVCIIPGIDLMEQLIELAADNGFTAGFLGGRDEVAEKTRERLQKKYPKLKVTFAESGGEVDKDGNMTTDYRLPTTDLLFVAFGPPKQEKWIAKNLQKLDVKVAMGVGGAFDYLSNKIPRAPKWIRGMGLEWLFRLIVQPWRWKRQLRLLKYLFLLTKN